MKKFLILGFALLMLSARLPAQNGVVGNLTAATTTCLVSNSCLELDILQQMGGATIKLSGTFSATVQFEASADPLTVPLASANWVAISATPSNSTTTATSATSAGVWQVNVAAYKRIRIRVSTYGSGTVAGAINLSTASARGGSGGGGGGGSIVSCTTTGGVAYENGTNNTLTCGSPFTWDPVTNGLNVTGPSGQFIQVSPNVFGFPGVTMASGPFAAGSVSVDSCSPGPCMSVDIGLGSGNIGGFSGTGNAGWTYNNTTNATCWAGSTSGTACLSTPATGGQLNSDSPISTPNDVQSVVGGVLRAVTHKDSAGNIVGFDFYPDPTVTDEGNAATVGSFAWAEAQVPANGAYMHVNCGAYAVITGLLLVNRGQYWDAPSKNCAAITFNPTTTGKVLFFFNSGNASATYQQGGMKRMLLILGTDEAGSVAIELQDTTDIALEDMATSGTGSSWHDSTNASIGLLTKGRQGLRILGGGFTADIPWQISKNPNVATIEDCDFCLVQNAGFNAGGSHPAIVVDSGVQLTNFTLQNVDFSGGTDGFHYIDTTSTANPHDITLSSVRYETSSTAGAYIVNISFTTSGHVVRDLTLQNITERNSVPTNGIFLQGITGGSLTNSDIGLEPGYSGKIGINTDSTVTQFRVDGTVTAAGTITAPNFRPSYLQPDNPLAQSSAQVFQVDDVLDASTVLFNEEFLCAGTATLTIGAYNWSLITIGGAPTASCATGPSAAGALNIGSETITTSGTSGQGGILNTNGSGTLGNMSTLYLWDSYFRALLGSAANVQFRLGYMPNGITAALPGTGFYLRYDTTLKDITASTYTSGGTTTGTVGQTCNATFIGGTATAHILLTGTNVIAGGSAFVIDTMGVGYNSTTAPTQATLSSGTATCSGTATVSPTLGATGSGPDAFWTFVASPSSASVEIPFVTSVAPDGTNYVKVRIRNLSTSTREIGFTLYDNTGAVTVPEVTFCTSGCTVTETSSTNVLIPAMNIATGTTATKAATIDFWKFRAFNLAR